MQTSFVRSIDAPPQTVGLIDSGPAADFFPAAATLVALRGAPPEAVRAVTEVAKDGRKVVLSLVDDAVTGTINGAPARVADLVEALGFTRFFNAVGALAKGGFGKVFGGAVGIIADLLVNAEGGSNGTTGSPQVVKLTQAYMERMAAENPDRLVLRKTEFVPGKPLYQLRDRQTDALYVEAGGELGVRRHGDIPEPPRQAIPAAPVVMAPVRGQPSAATKPQAVLPLTVNALDPFGLGTSPGVPVLDSTGFPPNGSSSLVGRTFDETGVKPLTSAVSNEPPFIEKDQPQVLPPVTLPPDPLAPLAKAHGALLDRFMALKLDYDLRVAFEQGQRLTPGQAKILGEDVKRYEAALAADPLRATSAPALELAPAKAALKGFEAAQKPIGGTYDPFLPGAAEEFLKLYPEVPFTEWIRETSGPLGGGEAELERRLRDWAGDDPAKQMAVEGLLARRKQPVGPTNGTSSSATSGGAGGTTGTGGATGGAQGPEGSEPARTDNPILAENAATLAAIAGAETGALIRWAKGEGEAIRARPAEIQREILLALAARYDSLDPAEKADADAIARTILDGPVPGQGISAGNSGALSSFPVVQFTAAHGLPNGLNSPGPAKPPAGNPMSPTGPQEAGRTVDRPDQGISPDHTAAETPDPIARPSATAPEGATNFITRHSTEPAQFTPRDAIAFLRSYGMGVYRGTIGDATGKHSPSEFVALISALAPAIEHVESRFPGLLSGVRIAREQAEDGIVAEVVEQRIVTFRSLDFLRRWGEVKGESISDLAFHEFSHVIRNKTPDVVTAMLNWGLPLAVVDNSGSIPGSITADRLVADHLPGFPLWSNTLRVHGLRAIDMNGRIVPPEALSGPATPPYVVLSNRDGAPTRLEQSGGLVSRYGEQNFDEAFAEIGAQIIGFGGPSLSPGPLDQRPDLTGEGKPGFSEMPPGYLMRAMFFAIQDARRATVGPDGYFQIDGFPTILQFILDGNSILHPRRDSGSPPPPAQPDASNPTEPSSPSERGPQQMAAPVDRPGRTGGLPFPPNVVNLLLPSAPSGFYQAAENVVFPENGVVVIGENSSVRSLGRIAQKVESNPYFSLGCPVYAAWCVSAERDTVTRTSEAQALHELIGAPVQGYLGYFTITPEGIRVPPPRNFGGDIPKLILPFRHEP